MLRASLRGVRVEERGGPGGGGEERKGLCWPLPRPPRSENTVHVVPTGRGLWLPTRRAAGVLEGLG